MPAKTQPTVAEDSENVAHVDEDGYFYASLRVGDLEIDKRIQRDAIREKTLSDIRATYNRPALNTLAVSQRANGKLYLIDGQHRQIVVIEKEPDGKNALVPCKVYTGLNLQEEAKLFVELNNQEGANPLDKHKARVTQKDPVALALRDAAKAYGWEIGSGSKRIGAVRLLETLYYAGESAFQEEGYGRILVENTIGVVANTWSADTPHAMSQDILKAVGELVLDVEIWVSIRDKDHDYFDYKLLSDAMRQTYTAGPSGWVSAMRGQAKAAGKSLSLRGAMRRSLFDTYNRKQKKVSRKLPEELAKPRRHHGARTGG